MVNWGGFLGGSFIGRLIGEVSWGYLGRLNVEASLGLLGRYL